MNKEQELKREMSNANRYDEECEKKRKTKLENGNRRL